MGQTDRSFACRLKEHRRAFKSIDSAVAEHAFNSGHTINWDNAGYMSSLPHTYTSGIVVYILQKTSHE